MEETYRSLKLVGAIPREHLHAIKTREISYTRHTYGTLATIEQLTVFKESNSMRSSVQR